MLKSPIVSKNLFISFVISPSFFHSCCLLQKKVNHRQLRDTKVFQIYRPPSYGHSDENVLEYSLSKHQHSISTKYPPKHQLLLAQNCLKNSSLFVIPLALTPLESF
ncbi:hypothetical protein AAZX31_14G170200 [Glycine max]